MILDSKLKPWLLEVNHAPSFGTDTPLDFKIKRDVIADTIQLLNLSYYKKQKFIRKFKSQVQK